MKSFGGIWDRLVLLETFLEAFHRTAKGKAANLEVADFRRNLHGNLRRMLEELEAGRCRFGPYGTFMVRDPKPRLIRVAPFEQRVMHHAIVIACGEALERSLIFDSYACRKGKGQHAAALRAQGFAQRSAWYLKMDVEKFYDCICHARLLELLSKRFRERRVMRLFTDLVESWPEPLNARHSALETAVLRRCEQELSTSGNRDGQSSLPVPASALTFAHNGGGPPSPAAFRTTSSCDTESGRGLPIGNLTSQCFANFYLDGFDHWIKETCGVRGYVRYMDDMLVFGNSPEELRERRDGASAWLDAQRGLTIKHGGEINRVSRGVPFLGFTIRPETIRLHPRSARRYSRKLGALKRTFRQGRCDERELQRRGQALVAATLLADAGRFRINVEERQTRIEGYA